jgi:hypothetical protein
MHGSLALALAVTLICQESKYPPFIQDRQETMSNYYQSPDPELGPQLLKELLDKKNLDHPWVAANPHFIDVACAELGDIAAGKPKIVRKYEAYFDGTSTTGRLAIIRALENCGDKETVKQVDVWLGDARYENVRPELESLKKHLSDPKRKHIRDRPAQTPEDLDLLWANFFVTGEYAPASRILDVLEDPKANATLKGAALWSIRSNLHQHPKLVELVKKHAKERPLESQKAIDQLIKSAQESE